MKILENKIKCKFCGDALISEHRHDFKLCSCGRCGVDGGHDYLRRIGIPQNYEELSVIKEES